ncbi:MAG TPA: dienelactone hydrolase family protein, partial [Chthonomonadaceae bacterium]|nr:dienelactone hydrolase family protein [Chthonomonadaceae bacterium]
MASNNPSNTDIDLKEIDPALDPALDQLTRRTLLGRAGAGAAGLVASTVLGPAAAQETSAPRHALEDESLNRQEITYPSRGGGEQVAKIKAFLATPKTTAKRGSVIVIHEIFGLTDHIKDVACRLAQAGFTALAPDLFTREGAPPPMSGGFAPLMQFVGKIPDSQLMGDIQAALHPLRERPDSNHKTGIVGFCYGGRISMIADAEVHGLSAAVAYYGRITGDKTANQPAFPLDLAAQM